MTARGEPDLVQSETMTAMPAASTTRSDRSVSVRALILLPVVGMGWSLSATWMGARTGDTVRRYAGSELPLLRWALVILVVATAVIGLVESALGRTLKYALLPAGGFAALAAALLLLEEIAAALIPTGFLPTSIRRATVDVHGGVGIWVGLSAAVLLIVGARTGDGLIGLARLVVRQASGVPLKLVLAVAAAGLVWIAATWARYQPWAVADLPTERIEVNGWSLPWLGPLSLIAVFGALAGVLLLVLRQWLPGGLLIAGFGWLLSFLGSISVLSVETIGRADVGRLLPAEYANFAPTVAVGWGSWIVLALGFTLAALGAFVLTLEPMEST